MIYRDMNKSQIYEKENGEYIYQADDEPGTDSPHRKAAYVLAPLSSLRQYKVGEAKGSARTRGGEASCVVRVPLGCGLMRIIFIGVGLNWTWLCMESGFFGK